MDREEAYKVFKEYDPAIYEYYMKNAWYLGADAKRYAEYLKEKHMGGKTENEKAICVQASADS